MAPARTQERTVPHRILNRELSWLEFNARVLELAADESQPLLERVKFSAIFSANLDEFFMVRVAGLAGQLGTGVAIRSPDGSTPRDALAAIRQRVVELVSSQSQLWARGLRPALAEVGIRVARVSELDRAEREELGERFEDEIYPVLTPLGVGPGQPFPYISGLSLSVGVFVRDPDSGDERFARVKVPETLPRFLQLGDGVYVPLEATIAHHLPRLFPQMEISECAVFRVTRNADFEVSDEADDLLEAVELQLRQRRFGDAVRLEVSDSMSDRMVGRIMEGVGVSDADVYRLQGLLDLADLTEIAGIDRPDLKDEAWVPRTPAAFMRARDTADVFSAIARDEILVHHPYDSFGATFEAFVRGAATDDAVTAMKTTVYRTSDESSLVPALVDAAELGKQSVCLVELKARFDERRNIEWSRALERAGVHVVYGFANLKIHAKMTLVVRQEDGRLRRYVHLGTGNYHALTARSYEDLGLFTADEEVAADVADLFNHITGFGRPVRFRKLLVAPFGLREGLIHQIDSAAAAAKAGKQARVRMKVNALTDPKIISALYSASQAGAEIEIVARSICALSPGVEGLSESIRVRSVLGRFLEHSRVYTFQAGKKTTTYIGSADLMPRNLDHRLEILVPVESAFLQQHLSGVFDVLLADNAQAWDLREDGTWRRARPAKDEAPSGTHDVHMRKAVRRARAAARTVSV